jgi:hypothetical protein
MRGRGRARGVYRVYADEDFLEAEESSAEGVKPDGEGFTGAPLYTATRRELPRPLGGRIGVALVALAAMAVSALVVHGLRAGLAGGGTARSSAPAPIAATAAPTSKATALGGAGAAGDARNDSGRAARVSSGLHGEVGHRRARTGRRPPVRTSGAASASADRRATDPATATVVTVSVARPELSDADAPSAISAAVPEFGFER